MRKATRKNKRNGKQILRKKQTFRKNIKISGGYQEENRGTWIQVVFNEEEKQKIKKYLNDNSSRTVLSTEIRDKLFPDISQKAKDNAAHEIQVILGRAYSGS
jgi:hypothetical protein